MVSHHETPRSTGRIILEITRQYKCIKEEGTENRSYELIWLLLAEKFANDFHFGEPGNLGCKSYRTTEGKALGRHTFATEFPLNKFQAFEALH